MFLAQKTLKRKAGMEGTREQRGRRRPVYAIQQQIAAFKTERTRRKHAYKLTFVRSNIFLQRISGFSKTPVTGRH